MRTFPSPSPAPPTAACRRRTACGSPQLVSTPRPRWPVLTRRRMAGFEVSIEAPDETGWKVGGRLWWLWVFVTPDVTVYAIQPGRGYTQAAAVLGPAPTASSSATAGR